nr:MAG TPA: hypothetical protein [Caudoviricetes sp.]
MKMSTTEIFIFRVKTSEILKISILSIILLYNFIFLIFQIMTTTITLPTFEYEEGNRLYTSHITHNGASIRTSQRAGEKFNTIGSIMAHLESYKEFQLALELTKKCEPHKKFTQNTIRKVAFNVLARKFGWKNPKKMDDEQYDRLHHTILKRIDDDFGSELAHKYLDAIKEKAAALEEGEKIKNITKTNLLFSILKNKFL